LKSKVLYILFLFLFTGCNDDFESKNSRPELSAVYVRDGLSVSIVGSANDMDGKVSVITISWGDSKISRIIADSYESFERNHSYSEPGIYNILITAIDNSGDSTKQSFLVELNYKETSLANIKESMFKLSENEYLILTINLHTYQEARQNEKFNLLTDVIGKMDIDFVAFQECAQYNQSAITEGIIREDNMALIISNRLKEKYDVDYNFVWHWAHYGWSIWEEGVAVLSKHPLVETDNRYISTSTSINSITSRKVIYGSYQIAEGRINIFTAHIHWRTSETDEEQNNQIRKIKAMADEKETVSPNALTLVCGDFNGDPTSDFPWSEGYNTMVLNGSYIDSFLEIYSDANNKPAQSIYSTIGGYLPGRIDYIFIKNNTRIKVEDSQIIFTNDVVGTISDHFGVLTKISITN
jgi:maltose 6'-phosphate phosphatase